MIFESDTQRLSSLTYVALWAILAAYLIDVIHILAFVFLFLQSEEVLADGVGRIEGTCNAYFLSTLTAASDKPSTWGDTYDPAVSFCSRIFVLLPQLLILLFLIVVIASL